MDLTLLKKILSKSKEQMFTFPTIEARLKEISNLVNDLRASSRARSIPDFQKVFLCNGQEVWQNEEEFLTNQTVKELLEAKWGKDTSGIFDFKAPASPLTMSKFPAEWQGFWVIGQIPTAEKQWKAGIMLVTNIPGRSENSFRACIY